MKPVAVPPTLEGKHYRVKELATLWGVSTTMIRDLFNTEPGVVRFGKEVKGHRRGYFVMLIPEVVAARVYARSMAHGIPGVTK